MLLTEIQSQVNKWVVQSAARTNNVEKLQKKKETFWLVGSISGPVISVVSLPVTRIPPAETDSVLHTTDFKYQNDSFSHVVVHQYEPWLLFGEDVIANLWLVWLLFAICCSRMIFWGSVGEVSGWAGVHFPYKCFCPDFSQ